MTTPKDTVEEIVKEFEEKFTYGVLYSASSDLSAGKGTHFRMDDAKPAIQWLRQALHATEARVRAEILTKDIEELEGMNKCFCSKTSNRSVL